MSHHTDGHVLRWAWSWAYDAVADKAGASD